MLGGGDCPGPLPSLTVAAGNAQHPWLVDASFQSPSLSSVAFSVPLCPFLSLMQTLSLDLGPTLIQYDLLSILTLFTPAKTLFPNEIMC